MHESRFYLQEKCYAACCYHCYETRVENPHGNSDYAEFIAKIRTFEQTFISEFSADTVCGIADRLC